MAIIRQVVSAAPPKKTYFYQISIFFRKRRDEEIVCYGDLGCFHDDGPFNYLDMLPASPDAIGTQIILFTRKNPKKPQVRNYFFYV